MEKETNKPRRNVKRSRSLEARENKMICLAEELAEKQLIEGTASSAVITHYLKLGSTREKKEQDRLSVQNEMFGAKTKALNQSANKDDIYRQAIEAMRSYRGES